MSNQAAWLSEKNQPFKVGDASVPQPGPNEVVIKNGAIAINPVDWKIQDSGYFIKKWPIVLGTDAAGVVHDVGSEVVGFKKGDRVLGHCTSLLTQDSKNGGFQLYSATPAVKTAKIPDSVTFTDAAVLPLAISTAAAGLYQKHEDGFLGLDLPKLGSKKSGKTVLVYGGSSSVGAVSIQLAKASGAYVLATASKHNFDFCRNCGADEVFDYKSSSVVDDVVKAIKANGGEFVGIYDAIALQDSLDINIPILEKVGGNANLATVLPAPPAEKLPSGSKGGSIFALVDAVDPVWKDYVPEALEQGSLKCLPPPLVVGKGLENVEKGCQENKKGVSAKKVVVEL